MSKVELWFEGYVGLDKRITVTRLPEKFSHEAWEALDQMLNDTPAPDLDIESQGFYRFKLSVESGFEAPDEDEFAFDIEDWDYLEIQGEEVGSLKALIKKYDEEIEYIKSLEIFDFSHMANYQTQVRNAIHRIKEAAAR